MSWCINWLQFTGALELGLTYALVSVGVYLSFRTLQFPDLTVDGSFPLGAAVAAAMITAEVNPYLATGAAVGAGMFFGFVTAWLSTHLRMLNLIAGILTMTALYSINLRIMGGKPNLPLLSERTIFTDTEAFGFDLWLLALVSLLFCWLTYYLLSTQLGLAVRATGSNSKMARAQGINDNHMIWLGLSVSNALVALAGAIFAQKNGFADVTLGPGTLVEGLAGVIIGQALLPTRTIAQAIFATICGAVIFRLVIAQALNIAGFGIQASDLKLITALLVALAMMLPHFTRQLKQIHYKLKNDVS